MPIKRKNYIFIALFILITLLFNLTLVQEIITSFSSNDVFINDGLLTEFLSESEYQNTLQSNNPFIVQDSIIYPFQINISLNDPNIVNMFFYLILRPFASSYISTILIVFINFFLTGWLMYLLLKHFEIRDDVAFIITLSYTFMPFMSHRVLGHYSYTALYLFPLVYLMTLKLFSSLATYKKIVYSIGLGLAVAWSLMVNPYYFFSIIVSYALFGIYILLYRRSVISSNIRTYWSPLIGSITIFIITLFPWLKSVYETRFFQEPNPTVGVGSSITLSADVLSFVMPSYYNPIYRFIFTHIIGALPHSGKLVDFYINSWNRFAYPGILFIALFAGIFIFRKRISQKIRRHMSPFLFVSIGFIILTLGPFLKIVNRWFIIVDEGIPIFFPLPFLIIRYIPLLNGLRAPMRFTPAYVFFGLIAGAFVLQWAYSKLHKKYIITATVLLFILFFADQWYVIPTQQDQDIPSKIYEYVRKDAQKGTVLEIPYTLRDGLRYIGFVYAITPIKGYLVHGRPTMGGYLPRLQPYIFSYYKRLPFMSYVASIIDKGNYNPFREQPQPLVITEFTGNIQDIEREIDFFDIQYIMLKNDEEYSDIIRGLITQVGFTKILSDQDRDLYYRPLTQESFAQIDIGSNEDYLFLVDGLSESQGNYRSTNAQIVRLFIKPQGRTTLTIEAVSQALYPAGIYMNKEKINDVIFSPVSTTYDIPIPNKYDNSIVEFIIRFEDKLPKVNFYSIKMK